MKRLLPLFLIFLTAPVWASISNPTEWTEEDGSPSVYDPYKVKVSNGTLTDNGDGTISVTTGGGGGTPGGTDTNVQFNDGGSFGGDGTFLYYKGTNTLVLSRDSGQTGEAIRISSDTGVSLAAISHDGTASFASIRLGRGTNGATQAPLQMTPGDLMATPVIGGHEFSSDKAYVTITTGTARKEFTLNDGTITSGRVPYATTNGRLTDSSTFTFNTSNGLSTSSGLSAPDTGSSSERLGLSAVASGSSSIAIGNSAQATNTGSIAIGNGASVNTANLMIVGGNTAPINEVYFGNAVLNGRNASPSEYSINGVAGSGTDVSGANLVLAGGKGTGTGIGGTFIVRTTSADTVSSSTANTLVNRFSVDTNGVSTFSGPVSFNQARGNVSSDGAAFFKSLQLDTSLAAIEGGTGQSSFTKGDILVASDGTTLTKLAVGSMGQMLSVDTGTVTGVKWVASPSGSGAPTDVDYLVGTASGSLSAEIVAGTSPGGELGGTWGSPTIDDSVSVSDWTLTAPTISGTPNAAGELGYDTTQKMITSYGGATAVAGSVSRVLTAGVGTETVTNDSTNDRDFTALYTFPADSIYTNKVFRVTVIVEMVTGVSATSHTPYLKLGGTDVYRSASATQADNQTDNIAYQFYIFGRAASGASAGVSASLTMQSLGVAQANEVNIPVSLATNGTLALVFGMDWSGTGSTETLELQAWIVEELN